MEKRQHHNDLHRHGPRRGYVRDEEHGSAVRVVERREHQEEDALEREALIECSVLLLVAALLGVVLCDWGSAARLLGVVLCHVGGASRHDADGSNSAKG